MSTLTDLWDCRDYSEKKRVNQRADLMLERVHLTLLAGTQPGDLQALLPEIAGEQGFLARVRVVYAASAPPVPLWRETVKERRELMQEKLGEIAKLRGEFAISNDARIFLENWNMTEGKKTGPTHPKLQNYNARRVEHLIRLCMVAAASGNSKQLSLVAVERALEWLINAEENMVTGLQDITNAAISRDDIPQMIYDFVLSSYSGESVSEARVVRYVHQLVRPHDV